MNRAFLRKAISLIFCVVLTSGCSDQGCIDADDFGEYESQTLEILANASAENCTYDFSKGIDRAGLTDATQGSGIKVCLISGSVTLSDENGISQTNNNDGCLGFTSAKFTNLCVNNCVQLCNSNASGASASAEPYWVSTSKKVSGKNSGVTIRPGSQVIIRAVGNVVLGDAVSYPDMYVQASNPTPNSKNNSWGDIFFDSRNTQSVYVKFSGQWTDGADTPDPQALVGGGTVNFGTANDHRIYNGAKRIVAFLIPHPTGYEFNTSAANEKSGSKGVPLLPDAGAWQCSYSGADKKQSACGNAPNGYTNLGYNNINETLTAATFPVNSNYRSTVLAKNGGIIRWDNDGLEDDTFDPFAAISVACNGTTGNCTNITSVSGNQGRIIGDLSSGSVEIVNNNPDAYKVSLKSLVADSGCNLNLSNVRIVSGGNTLNSLNNFAINNTNWSSQHLTLEPGQKLVIAQNAQLYNSSGVNCGRVIGVRFAKYLDLVMEQSGFVKFTMLRGSGTCTIKGRIVNPLGSPIDVDTSYTADFYENDSFSTSASNDPLYNLSVAASPPIGTLNWSNRVFVRKGQVIRFSPESWNNEWITDLGLQRKCGIGMAMMVEPRPALLCRGKATDTIDNPLCIPNYDNSGNLLGCQSLVNDCSDSSKASSYCSSACQRPITCAIAGNAANNYQRSGCTYGAKPTTCTYPAFNPSCAGCTDFTTPSCTACVTYSDASCTSCANLMVTAASQAAKITINAIDQCYDLENYRGKVANISTSTTLTKSDVDAFLNDSVKGKGLKKLGTFNGDYGNLSNISATSATQTDAINGNIVYSLQTPLSFVKSGRLKFLMLDGNDFNGSNGAEASYNNNSVAGGSYGGTNGYRIQLSGTLEFSNGVWLQARLCQESSNDSANPSTLCKNSNPIAFTGQPTLVEITPPTSTSPAGSPPALVGNYKFDDYGNIVRTSAPGQTGDCTIANSAVDTIAGGLYYCHTYKYFTPAQLKSKSAAETGVIGSDIQRLRLTFKILDPEIGNCNLLGVNDGIKMNNPFYDSASGSTGQICGFTEIPGNGTTQSPGTCKKQFYCANKYSNNSGKYFVNVKVKNSVDGAISSIIGSVIQPVVEVMDGKKDDLTTTDVNEKTMGQAERVYKLLITDPRYKAILTMSLVTMFTFYGFGYLIGAVELSHSDIINRIIKIGLIYLFVGETGWDWFNKIVVKFFKDSTDYLSFMMASSFDDSPELSNAIMQGNYYDKSLLFSSVDKVFSLFFSSAVQKKVSALLFASIFGWAYLMILYSSFMLYVYAVANAVLLYLTAQVFISVLFVLGPIFFVFTLFAQTKEMFDNWLKQLISFSLQQIFLLTTLAFFNLMMYEVIKMALGYKICWDDVWTINIITRITLLSFWNIASLPPRTNAQSEVGNIGNPEGIPSLFTILFIWVIASLMEKFISFMTDLAAGISGGLKASELGSGVAGFAKKMKGMAGENAKKFLEKTGAANAVRELDKFVFDSGKLAEESRMKKRKQNAADLNNKSAMSKAGDKAISDYKKKNAKELMGKTPEQQREMLTKVRDDAMNKEGKSRGLNDEQIKALKEQKGVKYAGSNVLGLLKEVGQQALTSGGTINKGIGDRNVDTKFSRGQAQSALKNMSAPERKQFVEAAKQGKVEIGKSKLDSALATDKGWKRRVAAVATLGTSEALIAAGKGIGSGAGKVGRFFHDKEYDAAEKQLEKEGIIDKNSVSWSRPDSEKEAVRKRAKQNKLAKKNAKGSKVEAVADLEREVQYLEDQEQIDDSSSNFVAKGARSLGKYLERGAGRFANALGRGKDKAKVRNSLNKGVRTRAESDLKNINEEKADLQESRAEAYAALEEANETLRASPIFAEIENIDRKIGNGTATDEEKSQLKRLQREAKNDSKLAEASANAKKATVAIHQIDSQMKNLDEKAKPLMAVERADEIRIGALESAVMASDNTNLQDAYNEVSNPEELEEFVKTHGDDLGEDFAALNERHQGLTTLAEFNTFANNRGKE